jgi:hypothetical protein
MTPVSTTIAETVGNKSDWNETKIEETTKE